MSVCRAKFESALRAHAPGCDAEASHRERMLELVGVAGDPFSRRHFEPGHFTASAFVLSPDEKSMLFIHHGKLHTWVQPGGHIDADDADVHAAARREVAEETGLTDLQPVGTGVFDLDIHPIPPLGSEPAHEHFDVRYLLRSATWEFTAGDEVHHAKWIALSQVAGRVSDASCLRAVGKIRV